MRQSERDTRLFFRDNVNFHCKFPATDDVVQTLPYKKFIEELQSGTWRNLPTQWIGCIHDKLSTATESSIKSIKLVRILGTDNLLPGNDNVQQQLDSNNR